jgi:hypothetical protein
MPVRTKQGAETEKQVFRRLNVGSGDLETALGSGVALLTAILPLYCEEFWQASAAISRLLLTTNRCQILTTCESTLLSFPVKKQKRAGEDLTCHMNAKKHKK